jgi:CubicO group peptidase (beta-lactamase class C family)
MLMTRSVRSLLLFFIAAACFSSCNYKEDNVGKAYVRSISEEASDSLLLVYDEKNADQRIDEYMRNLHAKGFNGNVLVAKKGKIVYQNAFGWADYLRRDSLDIDSQFELASITKTMTATAILLLMERGKLRLDQNVRDFFPNFPYDSITVEHLLTHRSGMMNYVYFVDRIWKAEKRDERKGISNTDVMNLIAERKPNPYLKPGVKFHYNNSNYMVLAAIIEKVSGMSYASFMKINIFRPSGMKNTSVYSKAAYDKIPVDVVGHDRNSWRYSVVQNFLDGPVGDKGIYSTVGDLFLFDRALRSGRLIQKRTQDSAYAAHNPLTRGHFSYGYGWRIFERPGDKVVYHTGWWHGFRHNYLRDLKNDIVIVLLTNKTNASLHRLDELFNIAGMPVVRRGAYSGDGDLTDDE